MKNVLDYLERSAKSHPLKTAVEENSEKINYSSLMKTSQAVGTALISQGLNHNPVAVYMEKGINTLTAFFGCVYAGAFYSLVSPEHPQARVLQIQSVLEAKFVITDSEHFDKAVTFFPGATILLISNLQDTGINQRLLDERRNQMIDTDPLYMNFTSGTTGVPKGIVVSHRSVIDFIDCFTEIFSITEDDIIANQAPFDFDVSVKDIYSALSVSAKLVIVPHEYFSAPQKLIDYVCDKKVTTMIWAVSAMCLLSTFHCLDYRTPKTVRKVLFSGETMPYKHLTNWQKHLPNAQFVNLYGPTEITCNCTYHILDNNRDYSLGIPIGKPFPNEDVFLLDGKNKKITEPGKNGEIAVRGTALALGYYRLPKESRKRFVQNPLNKEYAELIYRTGDLGCYNEKGEIMFCGRKDNQVKHMGHRIELDEIEREMSAINGVERCVCIFDSEKSKLKAFYTGTIEKAELHSLLTEKLPVFMIPGYIRKIDKFPLTKNGKVDRKALIKS